MKLNYAIVFVSDMTRSVAFYRDVVGLPLRFETPGWSEFGTEGATLALHSGSRVIGQKIAPNAMPAGQCRPAFSVADLDTFHARMIEHGVELVHEPRDRFGVRTAQYLDPDGLLISFSETPQTKE